MTSKNIPKRLIVSVFCFAVIGLTSCVSLKKNGTPPSIYKIKISQHFFPINPDQNNYEIYIKDGECYFFQIPRKNCFSENKDTLCVGAFELRKEDATIVDSLINSLWEESDSVFSCFVIDGNLTKLELLRGEKQKNITIFGCEVPDVNVLLNIINPYCDKAKIAPFQRTSN